MSQSVESSLLQEIARREQELDRLREALNVISGMGGAKTKAAGKRAGKRVGKKAGGSGRRGPRGPKTAEQKAKISKALKKAWARRKKAAE